MHTKFTEWMSVDVLVRVSIDVKRVHDHSNSYKGKHFNWVACFQFRVQFIIIMVGHGSVQADMVLENELRVLYFASNRKWSETLGSILSIYETSKPTSTVTHPLQQGHTS